MRILFIDHYFRQDIDAFMFHRHGHEYWTTPHTSFIRLARRIFHESVFTGLLEYHQPEHARARRRYSEVARQRVHDLYRLYGFDVIVAPSDTFFWIRPLIEATQELGIPFVVLQKESTIPPGWMTGPAQEWGRLFPFIADRMYVSSEHHRAFWINAGTPPERILVTGQPRFDIYRQPGRWRTVAELGLDFPPARKNVLYLTYDVSAYLPYVDRGDRIPWAQLREETEQVLTALAGAGAVNLLVKPHPQPGEDHASRLRQLAQLRNVFLLPGDADTRQLIVNADIVVGFQTTAMFEALAAGKDVIYTFWSSPAWQYAEALIPFHSADRVLLCARSPDELRSAVLRCVQGTGRAEISAAAREAFFTQYLGPLDGGATKRCLADLQFFVESRRAAQTALSVAWRKTLDAQRPAYCRVMLPRAYLEVAAWGTLRLVLPVAYPLWRLLRARLRPGRPLPPMRDYRATLAERQDDARSVVAACKAVLSKAAGKPAVRAQQA